jgi:hypothetical protein
LEKDRVVEASFVNGVIDGKAFAIILCNIIRYFIYEKGSQFITNPQSFTNPQ